MNKKIKQNRYKPEAANNVATLAGSGPAIDFCLKCIIIVAFFSVLSLGAIFVYDFITQSPFFNIKKIEVHGTKRLSTEEVIDLAALTLEKNIFSINLHTIETLIASHPWIESATVKRTLSSILYISIVEQQPLAIVKIENLADILINTQGRPFKEYNPKKDRIENLPIITGLDLTLQNDRYLFNGPLFNSIMDFLKTDGADSIMYINGDKNTGIAVETQDTYNRVPCPDEQTIQLKLGFTDFKKKLNKAKKISEYIDKHFPDRTISAMDLFNLKKVFIKTKLNDALHNNLEKGV